MQGILYPSFWLVWYMYILMYITCTRLPKAANTSPTMSSGLSIEFITTKYTVSRDYRKSIMQGYRICPAVDFGIIIRNIVINLRVNNINNQNKNMLRGIFFFYFKREINLH